MNRPSPRGGRRLRPDTARAARPEVAVPGSGGSATPASRRRWTFGHCWRTFGPRAFGRRRLGVWGQRWRDLGKSASNRHQKQKSPPRQCRAGLEGRRDALDATC